MSLNQLHSALKKPNVKFLFTDYYDTIVHRKVHPNQVLRIWAKLMIKELGLAISIDDLYFIRQESTKYLIEKLKRTDVEIPYESLKNEICKRLINANILDDENVVYFRHLFEKADFKSEASVQFLNEEIVETIKKFKAQGGKIFLVSDFYGPISLFEKLLSHHGIIDLFEGIYSSAALEKSKHTGTIYNQLLSDLSLNSENVMMIGDNVRSDYENAKKNGLNAYLLPHKKHLRRNKKNNLGNDKKLLKKSIDNIYSKANKRASIPYTEYIIFYHVFVERVYETCKRKNIKNLFFLSREGQFLKKLFDSYQNFTVLEDSKKIITHYLKISRQASLQFSLKPLEKEEFIFLKKKYSNISIDDFLVTFNFPLEIKQKILSEIEVDDKTIINEYFYSLEFKKLKDNSTFKEYYEKLRASNKKAFEKYLESFNANIENEGMSLVDIGWGGTMQESLYTFFETKIPVTGYYLGLAEIYNIEPKTKRYGLNFSVMPYTSYEDKILMANMQLYEQFSAADHGSTLGYNLNTDGYTLEYHKPEEKWLYDNYIREHQEQMLNYHKEFLKDLEPICYNQLQLQNELSKLALKVGVFQNFRKLKFLNELSKGFYQNVGGNQVGISYERPKIDKPLKSIISFLMTPEKYFRYLVKLRHALYNKNKVLAFLTPIYFIYLYYRFNKYLRFKLLHRFFFLKFNFFK